MKPVQTGIAVALALVVVTVLLILPRVSLPTSTESVDSTNDITSNSSTMTDTNATELEINDTKEGSGTTAETGDTVTVHYVGAFPDGNVFDASRPRGDEGFTFTLGAGQVIAGWDQGVVGMKVGGKRTLVIPASLGYGENGYPPVIPMNATLVFEVELLSVQKGQ